MFLASLNALQSAATAAGNNRKQPASALIGSPRITSLPRLLEDRGLSSATP